VAGTGGREVRLFLLVIMCIASAPSEGGSRGEITAVGSSTVYPFSAIVAEHFASPARFPTPVVRSTSTSEGFRLFCAGASSETPDVSNASRPISEAERASCVQNGVREIAEIRIATTSLILANAPEGGPLSTSHSINCGARPRNSCPSKVA